MKTMVSTPNITLFICARREQLPSSAIAGHPIVLALTMRVFDGQLLDIIKFIPGEDIRIFIERFANVSDGTAPGQIDFDGNGRCGKFNDFVHF